MNPFDLSLTYIFALSCPPPLMPHILESLGCVQMPVREGAVSASSTFVPFPGNHAATSDFSPASLGLGGYQQMTPVDLACWAALLQDHV